MKFDTIILASALSLAGAFALPHDDMDSSHDSHETHDVSLAHQQQQSVSNNTEFTMEPSPVSMHSNHHHSHNRTSILDDPSLEPQQRLFWEQYDPTTFFSAPAPHKSLLWAHVFLNILSWCFLYPISLTLSVAKSKAYLPVQLFQYGIFVMALISLAIYGSSAPSDLYPNNSYSKMSIAMFFMSSLHLSAAIVKACAKWAVSMKQAPMDGAQYVLANMAPVLRRSRDSGHGLDSDSSITAGDEFDTHSDLDSESDLIFPIDTGAPVSRNNNSAGASSRLMARVMSNSRVNAVVTRFDSAARVVYAILNRPMFVVGISYILVGAATGFRMGLANKVFNVLAHFIKGTIFFLYGILTLMRYFGAFADLGMAWNCLPVKKSKNLQAGKKHWSFPTMEFVECLLIFIYGCSNVFMEHLGNSTGAWSHKDLQHASIAFMYFGGGLCGLLIESSFIRRLVNQTVGRFAPSDEDTDKANSGMLGTVSLNPFPAFIVFWTGVLMSQHEQELPLSTAIHMQWGYLFSIGALCRLGTYALMYLKPPQSVVPSRPFTELITSFCLICGGMVFVQSNSETVLAMMFRSLDGMFTLNVNVGIAALIMGWVMFVMAFKAWATKRVVRRAITNDA